MIFALSLIVSIYIPTSNSLAEAPAIVKKENYTQEELIELTRKYANMYNVSYSKMYERLSRESAKLPNGDWDVKGQSKIYYKGVRENSWGLAQIHLPSHPSVTKEQAQDPEFSIEFMARHLSKGKDIWNCCNAK